MSRKKKVEVRFLDAQEQLAAIDYPMVQDAFPYILWCPIHDARTSVEHRALEQFGLDRTAVFRRDDPLFAAWFDRIKRRVRPCRCGWIHIGIDDAAKRGVAEAIEWKKNRRHAFAPGVGLKSPIRPLVRQQHM